MKGSKVLLVTDNYEMGRVWSFALSLRNIDVHMTATSEDAQERYQTGIFDLVLIVIHQGHLDGAAVCRMLRPLVLSPMLLLTPNCGESHILEAYAAGIDECIGAPLSPAVLLAKVEAWLRRSWTVSAAALPVQEVAGLRLDLVKRHATTASGRTVKLTNLELRLLSLLMMNRSQILEPRQIIDRVWGGHEEIDPELLKSLVYRLRKKLESDPHHPRLILSVRGEGYMFGMD